MAFADVPFKQSWIIFSQFSHAINSHYHGRIWGFRSSSVNRNIMQISQSTAEKSGIKISCVLAALQLLDCVHARRYSFKHRARELVLKFLWVPLSGSYFSGAVQYWGLKVDPYGSSVVALVLSWSHNGRTQMVHIRSKTRIIVQSCSRILFKIALEEAFRPSF